MRYDTSRAEKHQDPTGGKAIDFPPDQSQDVTEISCVIIDFVGVPSFPSSRVAVGGQGCNLYMSCLCNHMLNDYIFMFFLLTPAAVAMVALCLAARC